MINSAYHFASERTNRTEKGKQVNNFPAWICYLEIGYGLGSVVMLPNSRPDAHCSKISTQEANMGLKKKVGSGGVNRIRKAGNLGRRLACVPETNSQVFTIIID